MRKVLGIGFTVVCFACSSSASKPSTDAAKNDLSSNPAAADVAPDLRAGDVTSGPDLRAGDVANGPDTLARDVAVDSANAADGGGDTPPKLDLLAVDRGRSDSNDDSYAITDGASIDGTAVSDLGESCSCGDTQTSGPAAVSWGCFCSVERCTRTLADFVDSGDGGRTLKPGQQTTLLLEYAGCNRILVQAYTYSRTVPVSEYVFDRTTGALVGAKVWLDDRQHNCPFSTSGARWVFGYQSGSYPIPSTCQNTACIPGTGTCPM